MSAPPRLHSSEAIADKDGRPTASYIKFFSRFSGALQGQLDSIAAAVASILALENTTGGLAANKADKTTRIEGAGSIIGGGDLSSDKALFLLNDADAPGASMVYGTDGAGTKGWQAAATTAGLVIDSLADSDTTHAPSRNAVFDALATEASARVAGDAASVATAAADATTKANAAQAASQPLDTQLTSLAALAYSSNSLKVVRVNVGETGFELATVSAGSAPTGTGFTHITAGVQDVAAKLVDTADINAAQVTLAKIANASANSKLLGSGSAGSGSPYAELSLGAGLSMSGTTLSATGTAATVYSGIVSGSAAATMAIPTSGALDLDTDLMYEGVIQLSNATASGANISIYLNADTTAANYNKVFNTVTTVNTPTRSADAVVASLNASENTTIFIKISKNRDGTVTIETTSRERNTTNIARRDCVVKWTGTANVVGVVVSSSVAASLTVSDWAKLRKSF